MPCRSDYPSLTNIESELNVIFNIYDDLRGEYSHLKYPHPKIQEIECNKDRLDKEVNSLCKVLQKHSATEIEKYEAITQRWWLNHQIIDFKMLIEENKQVDIYKSSLSDYEMELMDNRKFLNNLVEGTFEKVEKRFKNFSKEQNSEWQKNITRHSFVQVMSSLELLSELLYLKISKNEIKDASIFKDYEKSRNFWKANFRESFEDWISFNEVFELKRYFEKYYLIIQPTNKARTYFDALSTRSEKNKNLVFTIADSTNAIKILRKVKNKILEKESVTQ